MPFRPLLRFVWMYFIKLGFLDGRPGLIFCTLMTMHEAVISAKMYEQSLLEAGRKDESQSGRNKLEVTKDVN